MANYTITYSCGHQAQKQLFGPEAKRQSYIAWAEKMAACEECRKQSRDEQVAAVEAEHELPELAGSSKQVAWARQIRAAKIGALIEYMESNRHRVGPGQEERYEQAVAALLQAAYSKREARWWIDYREESGQQLAGRLLKETRA